MLIAGIVFAVVGSALFLTALGMTVRANAGVTIPFYRNPVTIPKWSILMRSVGAGLIVLSAAALVQAIGTWSLVAALAAPIIALVVIVVHNRRIESRPAQA